MKTEGVLFWRVFRNFGSLIVDLFILRLAIVRYLCIIKEYNKVSNKIR